MSDILLISLPFFENSGLLYLEASLKKAGYSCHIIDIIKDDDFSHENTLKEILASPPSIIIGFSVMCGSIMDAIKMIKDVKKRGLSIHIIMGGLWPGFKYREILTQIKEVDSVCVGEGEEVIVELSEAISKGKELENIPGLATRRKDGSVIFTPRKFRENIDDLPVPERTCYYFDIIKHQGYINIMFSRGCHRNCTFCSISSHIKFCGGKTWRPRSPIAVVNEIEYLINTTDIRNFNFLDTNFLGPDKKKQERYYILAEEIRRRKLDIKFNISSRIDGVTYDLFKELKSAGLSEVGLGVESLVEEQLKRYNKKISLQEIFKATEILDRLKINFKCFFIPLDPYVTREEIIENLDRMEKHRPDDHFSLYKFFWFKIRLDPYLPMFKRCLKDNLIRDFNPEAIDNFDIRYVQFHPDVQDIIEIADTIRNLYNEIIAKTGSEGRKKRMPFSEWDRIEEKISDALVARLYKYFREYIDIGDNHGGKEFIYEKMNKTCENIRSFAEEITREDILEFKEHIIDIDGIKISTRPPGFNKLITNIMEISKKYSETTQKGCLHI